MTVVAGSNKRDVIPRWRNLNDTIANGEIGPRGSSSRLDDRSERELARSRRDWENDQSQVKAAEFISTGLVLGVPSQVQDAVSSLLTQELPPALERLVKVVGIDSADDATTVRLPEVSFDDVQLYAAIAGLKQSLIREPRRPLAWLEIARLYSQLGQTKSASQSISRSLYLAPENRFILRSAAAFYTNLGDPERAHSLLVSARRTESDPWLIAAELATASRSKKKPKYAKKGLAMVEEAQFRNLALSELGAGLATIESRSGHDKRAKKLIKIALSNPTENAVAQVESLSESDKSIDSPVGALDLPSAFEARARKELDIGNWVDSFDSAELWFADQPFSTEAAVFASYVALSGLRDFDLAGKFAKKGMKANPQDAGLANNAAVAAIELGNYLEAEDLLKRALELEAPRHTRIALEATIGLLEFRLGHLAEGRAKYEEAIRMAQGESNQNQHALASIMLAREEVRLHTEMAASAMQRAERLIKRTDSKVIGSWLRTVEEDFKRVPDPRVKTN